MDRKQCYNLQMANNSKHAHLSRPPISSHHLDHGAAGNEAVWGMEDACKRMQACSMRHDWIAKIFAVHRLTAQLSSPTALRRYFRTEYGVLYWQLLQGTCRLQYSVQ